MINLDVFIFYEIYYSIKIILIRSELLKDKDLYFISALIYRLYMIKYIMFIQIIHI